MVKLTHFINLMSEGIRDREYIRCNGGISMIFLAITLTLISVLLLVKPEIFWKVTESWKGNADEPSEFYKKEVRFGGVICFLVGMLYIVISLI